MASEIGFLGRSAEEGQSVANEWLSKRSYLKVMEYSTAIDNVFSKPDQYYGLVKIVCDTMNSPHIPSCGESRSSASHRAE